VAYFLNKLPNVNNLCLQRPKHDQKRAKAKTKIPVRYISCYNIDAGNLSPTEKIAKLQLEIETLQRELGKQTNSLITRI
jgi:hypothetical protein